MTEPRLELVPLSSISANPDNPSLPTPRGELLLETSLTDSGFLTPGVLDRNSKTMDGHKRVRALPSVPSIDQTHAYVLHISGDTAVFVQRDDLDLDSPDPDVRARSHRAAALLNRTAELAHWDPETLDLLESQGVALSDLFLPEERAALLLLTPSESEPDFDDFSDFSEPSTSAIAYRVVVDNLSRSDADTLSSSLPNSRIEQYRLKPN